MPLERWRDKRDACEVVVCSECGAAAPSAREKAGTRRPATWRDRLAEYRRVRSAGMSPWDSADVAMGLREVPTEASGL